MTVWMLKSARIGPGVTRTTARTVLLSGLALVAACGDTSSTAFGGTSGGRDLSGATLSCTIPDAFIIDGGPGVDGIPALTDPTLVAPDDPAAGYLRDDDRVMGLFLEQEPVAVPLNILWWHEIVNVDTEDTRLAVTHCPLTGSSLTFARGSAESATFGVSGLLFMNNLLMYDRNTTPSLWPQMSRGARCGPRSGTALTMEPSFEMTWAGWRSLHPTTRVVSGTTGHARDYRDYPYDGYDAPNNRALLGPLPEPIDDRRPPKERILGIPAGDSAGVAFPFGVLDSLGAISLAAVTVDAQPAIVLWDRERGAAAAFFSETESQTLTFRVENGAIVDDATGSTWRVDGRAASGPLTGTRLTPVAEAFVAYWFAWAAFYPDSELWLGPAEP
jgi:hypothetical protein